MRSTLGLCAAVALFAMGCGGPSAQREAAFPAGEVIDLSHSYDEQTIFWPTAAEGFKLHHDAEGMTPAGYYYAANSFSTAEHGGTHLDAPVHFAQGHPSVDQIPIERFLGPAVVIDVTAQSAANADYQITVDDLQRAEREQGAIPRDAILLLRTGFSQRWPDAATYLGTAEHGEQAVARL